MSFRGFECLFAELLKVNGKRGYVKYVVQRVSQLNIVLQSNVSWSNALVGMLK